jgi:hypothetical protein
MSKSALIGGEQIAANNDSLCFADSGLNAARLGLAGCAKLNTKTGLDTPTVLTDSGFLVAIPSGKQIVVTCFYAHLNTASDWLDFEFVYTENANGTGTVVALSPKFRIETGTANSSESPVITQVHPPLVVAYSATSKALTMRAQTNDSAASATLGMNYWLEDIT